MKPDNSKRLRGLGFAFIGLALLLATACTSEPPQDVFIMPQVVSKRMPCSYPGARRTGAGAPSEFYMENQLFLSGDPGDIKTVLEAFPVIDDSEGPIDPIDPLPPFPPGESPDQSGEVQQEPLGKLATPGIEATVPPLLSPTQGSSTTGDQASPAQAIDRPVAFELYPLTDPGISIEDLALEVNRFASAEGLDAAAEPNYLTNLPVGGSGGDGGSGIVGDPIGNVTPVDNGRTKFLSQWVFSGVNSIRLFEDSNPHAWSPGDYTGAGAQIAVFDTTPLREGPNSIDWAAITPFPLCVWQPGLLFGSSGSEVTDGDVGEQDRVGKGEHGLFVSGLAHGVAPDAQIYLIEVLNGQAQGDVYSIVRAMEIFMENQYSPDRPTIFNLSLGLQAVRDEFFFSQVYQKLPSVSLAKTLQIAEQWGILVVAASGNDGLPETQIPAAYPQVLGVASSTSGGDASCFSNPGDLAAPSGNGTVTRNDPCNEETFTACTGDMDHCDLAVISNVTKKPNAPSGHAYWTGTSFSTPMVSGLAALILEAEPGLRPARVRRVLLDCGAIPRSDAVLGRGIINVEKTLTSCLSRP